MGGVHVGGQHLAAFDKHQRYRRYWKALFLQFINFAVTKAYFLFMLYRATDPDEIVRPANYTQPVTSPLP